MEWREFADWGLRATLAGGVTYASFILSKLNASVQVLNQQMAVILERDTWHTKWLERHDAQLERLEKEKK